MVLSRKKLREKLRTLLSADSDSKGGAADGKGEGTGDLVESVKERLREARLKRPRPTRPKRKRKKAAALGGEDEKEEKKEEEGERQEDEGSEEKKTVKEEKKKKKKKEKKKKDKKDDNKLEATKDEKKKGEDHEMKGSSEQNVPFVPSVLNASTQPIESFREEVAKKVYVGGIPYYSTEDDIKSFFEGCGTVTDIDCMKFPETGKFRGIAILTFKTESAAKRAISLDGSDMGGFYLKIQPYKGKGAPTNKPDFSPETIDGYNRIYIGNLSWDITEDDIKDLFKGCEISSIRFGTDKSTGEFKGYAHVDFDGGDSLGIALKLDQRVVRGRPVRIRCAVPKRVSEFGNDNVNVKKGSDGNGVRRTGEENEVTEGNSVRTGEEIEVTEGNSVRTGEEIEVHNKKQKRRTCYECGTPGHLSSACPNKKTNDISNNVVLHEDVNNMREEGAADTTQEVHNKKQKRRTCYECGIPGHLSSACPNKKTNIDSNNTILQADVNNMREEGAADTTQEVRKKQKRRTCYECGIPGHLSSDCPNKKDVVASNDMILNQDVQQEPESMILAEEPAVDAQEGSMRKKKKRRACYECGTPGHLSSECPNKTS